MTRRQDDDVSWSRVDRNRSSAVQRDDSRFDQSRYDARYDDSRREDSHDDDAHPADPRYADSRYGDRRSEGRPRGASPAGRFASSGLTVPSARVLTLAVGFALALGATLAVFLTDNPRLLRVAVIGVAWAFVLATLAAGRRRTDQVAAAGREAELRRTYELELEREVAARREYELELENELRRETEGSMRSELDALRGEIASLATLRDEVAGVSALRGDLASLAGLREDVARIAALRDEVARVAALRDDVAELTALRGELGQLGELRADMGRLRAELTEQLSSEMLVERIVMRTQASRTTGEPARLDGGSARALDGPTTWSDDVPPRELTGGWPAVRLDEPRETSTFERVRIDRTPPPPPPVDASWRSGSWDPAPPTTAQPWEPAAPGTGAWQSPPPWSAAPAPATAAFFAPAPPPGIPPLAPPPHQLPGDADRWVAPLPGDGTHLDAGSWWAGERNGHSTAGPELAPPPVSRHAQDGTAQQPPAQEPPTWQHLSYESYEPAAPQPAAFPPPTTERAEAERRGAEQPRPSPRPRPRPVDPGPPQTVQSPVEWLAARSLLDARPPVPALPDLPSRRRRAAEPAADQVRSSGGRSDDRPVAPGTGERPAASAGPPVPPAGSSAHRSAPPPVPSVPGNPGPNSGGQSRLAEILAENGVTPASGGRRRRRYRDEDGSDDVLARVLGRN